MDSGAENRRLRWQCRRGLLELDLLLARFLEQRYPALAACEREAFQQLLRASDTQLLAWLQGRETPPSGLKNIIDKVL